MSNAFEGLQPQPVWDFFYKICQIPRPSKHEQQMVSWLMDFARKEGLEARQDKAGNVLIKKPATEGMEGKKTVVLQSHVDMVGEKNSDKQHDFFRDAITPVREDGWIKADGTTLGADDGIGMAAQLALLASGDIPHGNLECLFTVDEETGMTGAFNLEDNFFDSRLLLNLDSEDEGELFIGCAGGMDTLARFTPSYEPLPAGYAGLEFMVRGLKGGHSGDDIHKGLGNANKILVRCLWEIEKRFDFRLAVIQGGNLRNAIAREARAAGAVPSSSTPEVREAFRLLARDVGRELQFTDPHVELTVEPAPLPKKVFTRAFQFSLLNALYACPHGVMGMSFQIEGLVESSTNLASVKVEDDAILVTTSQRSSVESARVNVANQVRSVFELAGAAVHHSDGYPGWTPRMDSELLHVAVESYERLFGKKPEVKAIHAGLECGLFLEKYPGMDMLSMGPTIKGAHSPDERLEINSVQKFWDHLLDILKSVGEREA